MALAPGDQLGPYKILGALGAGGMGEVYRAHDSRLNRDVAVKVLPARAASDPQALRRMEQEARAVAALNHPNLLSVYDIGTTPGGLPYMVCELLDGESLRERLRSGAIDARKAIDYATQLAHGLAAAHDQGITHRDLKPENIFLTRDGRVKILDFGLAKLQQAVSSEGVTRLEPAAAATVPGVVLGTVGYMSPEQVRGQVADARSDIFSFGAVFYEMLSGKRAFPGESAADVMSAVLTKEPDALTASATGSQSSITPALDRILRHCLEKESRQRFQSAGDIAFHLGDLTQTSGTAALAALPAARTRRPWAWLSAVVILAALAVWFALRPRAAAPAPTLERLTFQQGSISGAGFLPGNQGFVISANWNGEGQKIYQGQMPAADPAAAPLQALPGLSGSILSVSSQGAIAITAAANIYHHSPETLAIVSPGSGAARPVLPYVWSAAWSPDGSGLAVARFDPATTTTTLVYPQGHVLAHTNGWYTDLRFSHDGREIAFIDHSLYDDTHGYAAVMDLKGHERRLSPEFSDVSGLAWSPDGREVWFTAASASDQALYATTLSGQTRLLWQAPGSLILQAVAADGRALLISDQGRDSARVFTPAHPQGLDLTVRNSSYDAQISADGREVLLDEESGGNESSYSSWLRSTDGGPAERLGDGSAEALSPDGKWAASLLPTTPGQIMLLPIGTGQPRQLTHAKLTYLYGYCSFLPDSRALLVLAAAPERPARTWRISLDGSVQPVTPEGATGYVATPDGKFVLDANTQNRWALYPLTGGQPIPEPALTDNDRPIRFGANDRQLYAAQFVSGAAQVFLVNLQTRTRRLITTLRPPDPAGLTALYAVSISLDGKTAVLNYATNLSTLYILKGLH